MADSSQLRAILEKVRRGGARRADYWDNDPGNVMSVDEALKAIEAGAHHFYLDRFHYENWDCGDDGTLRVGDRINPNHQRPYDGHETNMTGSIVLHHVNNVPVVKLDEEWGSEYADLQGLMMDGWTFARLEPKASR